MTRHSNSNSLIRRRNSSFCEGINHQLFNICRQHDWSVAEFHHIDWSFEFRRNLRQDTHGDEWTNLHHQRKTGNTRRTAVGLQLPH
ncbi:hypothetical protein BDA96_01G060000 [Sorghum bicolor]|nr:hypothetical protein BDA96_01G060000 [Sorghum bicolor]